MDFDYSPKTKDLQARLLQFRQVPAHCRSADAEDLGKAGSMRGFTGFQRLEHMMGGVGNLGIRLVHMREHA